MLSLGVAKDFTLQLTVENKAEDSAYTSKLTVKFPDALNYIGPDQVRYTITRGTGYMPLPKTALTKFSNSRHVTVSRELVLSLFFSFPTACKG